MSNAAEKSYLLQMPEKMHTNVKVMASLTNSNIKKYMLDALTEKLERDSLKGGSGYEQES